MLQFSPTQLKYYFYFYPKGGLINAFWRCHNIHHYPKFSDKFVGNVNPYHKQRVFAQTCVELDQIMQLFILLYLSTIVTYVKYVLFPCYLVNSVVTFGVFEKHDWHKKTRSCCNLYLSYVMKIYFLKEENMPSWHHGIFKITNHSFTNLFWYNSFSLHSTRASFWIFTPILIRLFTGQSIFVVKIKLYTYDGTAMHKLCLWVND